MRTNIKTSKEMLSIRWRSLAISLHLPTTLKNFPSLGICALRVGQGVRRRCQHGHVCFIRLLFRFLVEVGHVFWESAVVENVIRFLTRVEHAATLAQTGEAFVEKVCIRGLVAHLMHDGFVEPLGGM